MGYSRTRRSDGPPGWFIFLVAMALIFGMYYLWTNLQQFMRIGGLSIAAATRQAEINATGTVESRIVFESNLPTRRPTSTPPPECQEFVVTASTANLRQQASTLAPLIGSINGGEIVCVIGSEVAGDGFTWYRIDQDRITRRVELGYLREDVIRAVNPTATQATATRRARTATPSITDTPRAFLVTEEADTTPPTPRPASPTIEPTATPSPTQPPLPTETERPPGIGI